MSDSKKGKKQDETKNIDPAQPGCSTSNPEHDLIYNLTYKVCMERKKTEVDPFNNDTYYYCPVILKNRMRLGHLPDLTETFNFDPNEWRLINCSFVYFNFMTPMYPKVKEQILLESVRSAMHCAHYYPTVDMGKLCESFAKQRTVTWEGKKMDVMVISYNDFCHIIADWRDERVKDLKSKLEAVLEESPTSKMVATTFYEIFHSNICFSPGIDMHFAFLKNNADFCKAKTDNVSIYFKYFLHTIIPSHKANQIKQATPPPKRETPV